MTARDDAMVVVYIDRRVFFISCMRETRRRRRRRRDESVNVHMSNVPKSALK
jgi:hypothetical protein